MPAASDRILVSVREIEGDDGERPSLKHAIRAFRCLNGLKYSTTEEGKKYAQYLQMVRDWRNAISHSAPTTTEQEIDAAIQIVVAMYLYVTGLSITDLEMAGLGYDQAPQTPYHFIGEEPDNVVNDYPTMAAN